MKKILLSALSLLFTFAVMSQGSVKFYTNNGTKEITKIKCGDFDNLKVKVKIPSNINKYDKVTYKVYLSSNAATSAGIRYVGKGAVSSLKPNTTMEKWIVSPGKKAGDFKYMGGARISTYDVCDVPRKNGLSNIEVEVQLVGYNENGSETYWDDWDKVYKTRVVYTKGNLLASGKITVEQLPAQIEYISANGVVSVKKVTEDLSEVGVIGAETSETGNKKVDQFNSFMQSVNTEGNAFEKVNVQLFGKNGNAAVDILMYSDEYIEQVVKTLLGEIPSDLDHYAELKRDLLQKIAFNSYRQIYRETFFKWPQVIQGVWSPNIVDLDEKKKFKKTNTNFFTNVALWKKEKVGDYEYDVLRIPEMYPQTSLYHFNTQSRSWYSNKDKSDVPGELVVYAIRRGNYSIFIFPYSMSQKIRNSFIYENDYAKDFVNKTIASIKFLK